MTILTIINDNPADYDFNETKRRMIEDYDYEDNISDEVVWNRIYNEIDYCYNDELLNLNVDTEGEIIAIASMDLWNGRFRI